MILVLAIFLVGPDTLWTRVYGGDSAEVAHSIQPTTDGGYIVVGSTRSFGSGGSDIWLLKLNAQGDTAWTRTFGGTYDDEGQDVAETADSGYIITGFIESSFGIRKLCLIKTDKNGTTSWIKLYHWGQNAEGYAVQPTTDSGYIITGMVSYAGPNNFIWLLKTDAGGDTIWCRDWGYPEGNSWGADVHETRDGGYILTGSGVLLSTQYYNEIVLIKTDASGATSWTRTYGDSGVHDHGYSVRESPDWGYILVGERSGSGFILKTDANGDSIWARSYGGSEYRSVAITADSGYIVTGTNGDVFLVRMAPGGDTLWSCRYGGGANDGGYSVEPTPDSGYIICGYTYSFGSGDCDAYIIRTEPEPGVTEGEGRVKKGRYPTIITGPLRLPKDKSCRVFDLTGREVNPGLVKPGIYFIEIEGEICQKVIKVR